MEEQIESRQTFDQNIGGNSIETELISGSTFIFARIGNFNFNNL